MKQVFQKNKYYILLSFFMFLICFYISMNFHIGLCPDEYMRYDIPKFLFNNNYLPKGYEKEIINPIWGFSYGFTPYLPSMISTFFMKIANIFSGNESTLLIAARFTSVLSGTFTCFICCKIGEELFSRKRIIYLFAILVSLLPQFIFLSSYINNDSFSVLTTACITFMWIKGIKSNWNYKICILLGISLGLCALTYYNAYGFILCSIFIYCISCYKAHFSIKEFLIKGIIIFISAFAIAGWFFIRNFIIHNGDFLGMNSMYECGEKYAMEGYQLSKRETYQIMGYLHPLLQTEWILTTIRSFFCATGYLENVIGYPMTMLYGVILFVGFIFGIIKQKTEKFKIEIYFLICLLLCMIIPIFLSAHYSYTIDYQPQGRYIMSMLVPLMLIVSMGYNYLDEKFLIKISLSQIVLGIYILLFVYCIIQYFIPFFTNVII